jgi:hypothetical protein
VFSNKQEKPNTPRQIDDQGNRVSRRTKHIHNGPEYRHDLRSQPRLLLRLRLRLHPSWRGRVIHITLLSSSTCGCGYSCACTSSSSLLLLSLLTSTPSPHPIVLNIRITPHKKLLLLSWLVAKVRTRRLSLRSSAGFCAGLLLLLLLLLSRVEVCRCAPDKGGCEAPCYADEEEGEDVVEG